MLRLPWLSSIRSPQFAVQLMETSGGSLSVRFLRSNSPVTVSTIVVSLVIARLNCKYDVNKGPMYHVTNTTVHNTRTFHDIHIRSYAHCTHTELLASHLRIEFSASSTRGQSTQDPPNPTRQLFHHIDRIGKWSNIQLSSFHGFDVV